MNEKAISLTLRSLQIFFNLAGIAFGGVLVSVTAWPGYIYSLVGSGLSLIWLIVVILPLRPRWPRLLLVCELIVFAFWVAIFGCLYMMPSLPCRLSTHVRIWYEGYFCHIGKTFWAVSIIQMLLLLISLVLMVFFNGIPVIGRYGPCGRPSKVANTYPGGIFDRGVRLSLVSDCESTMESSHVMKQDSVEESVSY